MADISKVALFTNESPQYVYGGAGVKVEYLSRELSRLVPVDMRCFGDQDVCEPNLREKFERNSRRRVQDHFSWTAIAQRAMDLYRSL